jgi:long-chain acyl-CoA synthetase
MRGPHVFKGYHRNEEAPRRSCDGGWLHSGDLGEIVDGYVHITGRKKDLIITSSGKNVSPEMLESALRETRGSRRRSRPATAAPTWSRS